MKEEDRQVYSKCIFIVINLNINTQEKWSSCTVSFIDFNGKLLKGDKTCGIYIQVGTKAG